MTAEQRAARQALKTVAARHRFRVLRDREGWPLIPGRLGQVEYHDERLLAVFTTRKIVRRLELAGCRRWQVGDDEARLVFAPETLPDVARIIRARRRRPAPTADVLLNAHKPTLASTLTPVEPTLPHRPVSCMGPVLKPETPNVMVSS